MLRGAAVEAASRGVDPRAALEGSGAAQLLLGPGVPKDSDAARVADAAAAARAVEAALDPRERWVIENQSGTLQGRDSARRLRRVLWESGLHINAASDVPLRGAVACLDGSVLARGSPVASAAIARGAGVDIAPPPRSSLALAEVRPELMTASRLSHVVEYLGLIGSGESSSSELGAGGDSDETGTLGLGGWDPFGQVWMWFARHTKGLVPFRRVSENYVEAELRRKLREVDLALEADDAFRTMLEDELGKLEEEEERASRGGGRQ